MGSSAEKDALFEAIALMGKAFASPRRLELLDLLAQAPRTVDELARASGQSTANTSQHLQALHAAEWSCARARARASAMRSPATRRCALWLALRDASISQPGRGRARRRDYLGDDVDAVGRDELITRLRRATRARRRPPRRGVRGRPHRRRALDPDRRVRGPAGRAAGRPEVVAYCRGPFCAYAHDAVRQLQAAGRQARRLKRRLAGMAARAQQRPISSGRSLDASDSLVLRPFDLTGD